MHTYTLSHRTHIQTPFLTVQFQTKRSITGMHGLSKDGERRSWAVYIKFHLMVLLAPIMCLAIPLTNLITWQRAGTHTYTYLVETALSLGPC